MAVLTGQAALDYMAKNQNYKVLNPGAFGGAAYNQMLQQPAPTNWAEEKLGLGGILGSVVSGVTSPFRRGILDPAFQIGHTLLTDPLGNSAIGEKSNIFTTEAERKGYWEDPLAGGIKQGAGIAAYAVPGGGAFGGGLKGAVTSGAISGGMTGFSGSESGNELGGTLGGATTGGLTSGALYGVGKLGQSLFGKGKDLNKLVEQYDGDISQVPLERIDALPEADRMIAYKELGLDNIGYTPKQEMAKVTDDMNALQKFGRERQFSANGLKAKNELGFSGQLEGDKDAINWALKETGLGKASRSNLSELPSRLGEIRRTEIANMDITVDSGEIIRKAAERLQKSSNIRSLPEAETMVRDRLNEVLQRQDVQGVVADSLGKKGFQGSIDMLNLSQADKVPLNQDVLFELTQKLGDDTGKVIRIERLGNFDPAKHSVLDTGRQIDEVVSGILSKESPKIAQANRAFHALYRQNPGIVQSFNRGANVSVTGGLASIPTQLWTRAEYWGGLGIEGIGDVLAGAGAPKAVTDTIAKMPLDQAATAATRLAPIYMARSQTDSTLNTPAGSVSIPTGGPQTDMNTQQFGMPQQNNFGGGGQMNPAMGSPMGTQSQGMDPRAELLGRAVLAGKVDPARAKLAMELLGIGGGAGAKLPASAVTKMADLESTIGQLDTIEQQIQSGGQFGPVTGGTFTDVLSQVPVLGGLAANPEREALKGQLDMLAIQMAKAMTGGVLSDRDIQMFKKLMPNVNDRPEVAQQKLNALRTRLQSQLGSTQAGFSGGNSYEAVPAGYEAYGGMF